MDGVNNLLKKQVLCKDDALVENFQAKNISDVENMENIVEDLRNEELHGEMSYISKDGVEEFVGESGSNFMNEEINEKNIVKGDEKVGGEENFEWNNEDYSQGNAHGNDDAVDDHGVRRTNSNIMGIHQFEWWRAECDLVDHGGVFIAKGRVVACDPQEAILDDWLGEDHVWFCILYCIMTMSTMMTIWKSPLIQTILDGYPFKKNLITFNETHIPDVDDVGI